MTQEFNPAAPRKVAAAERRIMALDLRKQGASYRQIAKQLSQTPGVSPKYNEAAAYIDVKKSLERLLKEQDELASENLRLDLDRMDVMISKLWPFVLKGDPVYINTCLGVLDRRAKLLGYANIGAQTQLNVDVSKLSDRQLERIANGEDAIAVLASTG